jgi:hypothetical protein
MDYPPSPCGIGPAPRITALLPQHAETWASAIAKAIEAIRAGGEAADV